MKQRTGEVFQGLITGVQSLRVFVEIEVPDTGRLLRVEGLVHVSSLKVIGMSIERDNRRCLVAKPCRLPAGRSRSCQVKVLITIASKLTS